MGGGEEGLGGGVTEGGIKDELQNSWHVSVEEAIEGVVEGELQGGREGGREGGTEGRTLSAITFSSTTAATALLIKGPVLVTHSS